MKTPVLIIIVLLSARFTLVDALRCYVCNSIHEDQEWCGVNFKQNYVEVPKECLGNCYKFQAEYYDRGARKVVVSRGCIDQTPTCQQQEHIGLSGYMCVCNKDLCNSGHRLSFSLYSPLLSALAMLLLLLR